MRGYKKFVSIIAIVFIFTAVQAIGLLGFADTNELSETAKNKISDAIVLYLDNPNAIVNNSKKPLDADDEQIIPLVSNQTTLVPIRFISENLGAKITWDQATSTVKIEYGLKTIKLVLGKNDMNINGTITKLNVPAMAYNQRIYIPLRAVTEAFGKKVSYDRGIIVIGDEANMIMTESDKLITNELAAWFNNTMPTMTLDDIRNAYKKSSVAVQVFDSAKKQIWQGSGFYIGNGLFVTNYHIVEGGNSFKLITDSNSIIEASGIIKYDETKDIAIIKSKTIPDLPALKLGTKNMIKSGDNVYVIGNPGDLGGNQVYSGKINELLKDDYEIDVIDTTIRIFYETSGSPLINEKGYVVGITSALYDSIPDDQINDSYTSIGVDYIKGWAYNYGLTLFKNIGIIQPVNVSNATITNVLNKHYAAYNAENVSALMNTIHEKNIDYDWIEQDATDVFSRFNVTASYRNMSVIERNFDSVKVRFTEKYINKTGSTFPEQENVCVYEFRYSNGSWKIYSMLTETNKSLKTGVTKIINGKGKLYVNGKVIYDGEISGGVPHGYGTGYDENGKVYFKGYWVNGEPSE